MTPGRRGLPSVAISIVTYQGERWIVPCLRSVLGQTYPHLELHITDNASTDGTIGMVQPLIADCEWARLTALDRNAGYAVAHNAAIVGSSSPIVCLLNQDLVLDPDFIAEAVRALQANSTRGSIQGRILRLDPDGQPTSTIDTTGLVARRSRRFLSRGQGQDGNGRFAEAGPVFGVDGPAPVYRRRALLSTSPPGRTGKREVLDEDFFLYHEDTDLAWRMRLLGWETWYAPTALAWHARGSAGPRDLSIRQLLDHQRKLNPLARRLSWRNHRLSLVKNEPLLSFLLDAPFIVGREIAATALLVATDPKSMEAIASFFRNLPSAMRKRRWIQRRRRLSARAMRLWFRSRPDDVS